MGANFSLTKCFTFLLARIKSVSLLPSSGYSKPCCQGRNTPVRATSGVTLVLDPCSPIAVTAGYSYPKCQRLIPR